MLINTMSTMWSNHDLDHTVVLILVLVLALTTILWTRKRSNGLPPGPQGFPLIGYLPFLGSELHREFADLAERYGPIFKFWLGNKLCVVITSPEIVKEVVREQDTVFANRDLTVSTIITSFNGHDIAFAPYGQGWKKLRKIFVREMLNHSTLDSLYHLRREEVRKSIKEIHKRSGEEVEMGSMTFMTVMNSVLNMSCGASIGGEIDVSKFKKASADLVMILGKPNVSDVFPSLARFDFQGIERDTRKVNGVFEDMFDSAIQGRKKMMSEAREKGVINNVEMRKDFLQVLLELNQQQQDGSVSISDTEVKALITDTVLGATDTTATTVEWIMTELLNNPEAMNKVYEELTQVVGLNSLVEESHLSKLTYLNAVIKETFRLHPPFPFLIPRYPSKSTAIGGFKIPQATKIFINVWAIQRDPKNWENPNEFRPERFLSGDGANVNFASGNNFNYIPFGSGRRICAGLPLAERIVIHILASFLHMFDWKLPCGTKLDLNDKFGIVLKKRDALVAIPTPRLSNLELYG